MAAFDAFYGAAWSVSAGLPFARWNDRGSMTAVTMSALKRTAALRFTWGVITKRRIRQPITEIEERGAVVATESLEKPAAGWGLRSWRCELNACHGLGAGTKRQGGGRPTSEFGKPSIRKQAPIRR